MNARYRVSIGDNNRDIVIGDANTVIRTGDITVTEGGALTVVVGDSRHDVEPTVAPVEPAHEGEILILIARFHGSGTRMNVEERLRESLDRELAAYTSVRVARLRNVVVEDGDYEKARRLGRLCRATIVIWGWYDNIGFRPCFTVVDPRGMASPIPDLTEVMIDSTNDTFQRYMFRGLPDEMLALAAFTAGQLFYWRSDFASALSAFAAVTARAASPDPVKAASWFYQGNILGTRRADVKGAALCFERAAAADPELVAAWYNLGDAHYNLGDLNGAIAAHSRVLAQQPAHLYALLERGDAYSQLGRYPEAIEDYTRAIRVRPWTRTYLARGRAFELSGQKAFAVGDYEAAARLDPACDVASERLKPYPPRGEGKMMWSRQGQNFDSIEFVTYYESALRVLGRDVPRLRPGIEPKDTEAVQLANALHGAFWETRAPALEAPLEPEEAALEDAGQALIDAILATSPDVEGLLGHLRSLVRRATAVGELWNEWGGPGADSDEFSAEEEDDFERDTTESDRDSDQPPTSSNIWTLMRLPAVRAKLGEGFVACAELVATRGPDYLDAARVLNRPILQAASANALATDEEVAALAQLIRALRSLDGRSESYLPGAGESIVRWVMSPGRSTALNQRDHLEELLESGSERRNALIALLGSPAVERRLGEKQARILRLLCTHGTDYPLVLRILSRTPLDELPASAIVEDPEAVGVCRLLAEVLEAAARNRKPTWHSNYYTKRTRSLLSSLASANASNEAVGRAYRDLRDLMSRGGEWADRMTTFLDCPPVAEQLKRHGIVDVTGGAEDGTA